MTSKTLYIVRHGKSTWDYQEIKDIDRPLKESGIQKTITMANQVAAAGVPGIIYSSPAARAMHTALIIAREINYPVSKVVINDLIYTGDTNDLEALIRKTEDIYDCMMIVGHNPMVSELANLFLRNPVDELPTSTCAAFCFSALTWEDVHARNLISEELFTG